MDAKTYLQQLQILREDMERLEDRIREMEEKLTSPRGMRYDRDRVQGSSVNVMEEQLAGKAEAMERLENLRVKYAGRYALIMEQIDGIENPTYRRVLKLVYVDGLTIRRAAKRIHYSEDWLYHILSRARSAFQNMWL